MKRRQVVIWVVGCPGSGKTTLASHIAKTMKLEHIELDNLRWSPDWSKTCDQVFVERIIKSLNKNIVVDGDYELVRNRLETCATNIIYIKIDRVTMVLNLIKRTIYNILTNKKLFNGRRESIARLISRQSIIQYALNTYNEKTKYFEVLSGLKHSIIIENNGTKLNFNRIIEKLREY